jgi:prepilin-type N-terminal cleavage/methylation domain-containing protein
MNLIKKIKKQHAFTLIELIISIFIITMITGLFLANYHSANERQELIMAAQKLASDIRLAQSHSLGAKEFKGNVPLGGWGVRFVLDSSDYIIFADDDGDFSYTGVSDKHDETNLPGGITINQFIGKTTPVDIVFLPPDPVTYIKGDPSAISVDIQLSDGETTKTVKVNFLGLVDVID